MKVSERNIMGIGTWVRGQMCIRPNTGPVLSSLSGWPSAEEAAGPLSRAWAVRHGGNVWGRTIFCSFWARHQHRYGYGSTGLLSAPTSCASLALGMFLLRAILLHGITFCLQLANYSQQLAHGHCTYHILWSSNFCVYFSLWKCCLQTLISSHAVVVCRGQ